MDKILEAAFTLIQGLAQGLLNALPELIEALPRIITTIIDFVTNNMPKIIELGITLIVQLAAGLVKAIPELVKSLPQIVAAIIEGLGKAVVSVVEIGKNIVKGIWEGIKSLGSWIKDKVSGFFSGIVDGVKNFLGIRSPSTVFEAAIWHWVLVRDLTRLWPEWQTICKMQCRQILIYLLILV